MAANPQYIETFIFGAGAVLAAPEPEEEADGTQPVWKFEAVL